jgi:mycothiol synthase
MPDSPSDSLTGPVHDGIGYAVAAPSPQHRSPPHPWPSAPCARRAGRGGSRSRGSRRGRRRRSPAVRGFPARVRLHSGRHICSCMPVQPTCRVCPADRPRRPRQRGRARRRTPQHRREGIATALLSAMPSGVRIWAHGSSAAATAFVKARGLTPVRDLHILGLTLDDSLPPAELARGASSCVFRPGTDEQAWVAVNAAAFASHPEQGRLTVADLRARMAQPWFDPAGLLMVVPSRARRGPDGRRLPLDQGPRRSHRRPSHAPRRGVCRGRAPGIPRPRSGPLEVTLLGLHHLRETGIGEAFLYVDGDNEAAVRTYRNSLGFQSLANETMFTHTGPSLVERWSP